MGSGTNDWSCAAWVLPGQTHRHTGGQQRGKEDSSPQVGCLKADSKRCVKLDSDWKPAKPHKFLKGWCLWWKKRFLVQTGIKLAEGSRVIFFGCLGGNRLWDRNLPLFQTVCTLSKKFPFPFHQTLSPGFLPSGGELGRTPLVVWLQYYFTKELLRICLWAKIRKSSKWTSYTKSLLSVRWGKSKHLFNNSLQLLYKWITSYTLWPCLEISFR